MHYFYDQFFQHSWCFFYRLTLTLMKVMQSEILVSDEMSDILDLIKSPIVRNAN